MGFDPSLLRQLTRARADELSIIRVSGDSMSPTLVNGDDVLVDRSEAGRRLRDGIYVLRRDDTLMVKRLAIAPTSATLTISSDNTAYPTWRDCPLDSVAVVGRAVWSGRKLS
jgi:phage repressor protein C with HTH and peptisase S24 domain